MEISLLKEHFEEYRLMQPQDAVKLAFQSAYGCGHLLPGSGRCMQMIEAELEATPENPDELPFVLIGNGLCRLNLAAPMVRALGADVICRMMEITQQEVAGRKGNDMKFMKATNAVAVLCDRGEAPFSYRDFCAYLDDYCEAGRPVVSHTQTYRDAYHPAYRVVLSDLALLMPVIVEDAKLIVFDGPCGSGKSTLARLLAALYDTKPIPADDFFLPPDMRTEERLSQPGGNLHRERFLSEVLEGLRAGGDVCWNRFDCQTETLIPRVHPASGVAVIEGSYSHHPEFDDMYEQLNALRVFVRVDADEQLARVAQRNPNLRHMFETRWIPLEKTYFEAYDIQGSADSVITSQPWQARSLFPKEEEA